MRLTCVDAHGAQVAVDLAPGETLLQAAERAGLRWLSGCRQGACRTCLVRVVKGQITVPASTAVEKEELQRGWVLACVAKGTSDVTVDLSPPPAHLAPLPWTD